MNRQRTDFPAQGSNERDRVHARATTQGSDDVTHIAQHEACDGVRLAHVLHGELGRTARRDVELNAERSEMVTQCVVDVSRDPEALGGATALRKQFTARAQLCVEQCQLGGRGALSHGLLGKGH